MSDKFDIDPGEAANPASLLELRTLAGEAEGLETQIKHHEEAIKSLSERNNQIKTKELPEKMAALAMDEFTLSSGAKVAIKDFVSGSLPKDEIDPDIRRPEDPNPRKDALDYLTEIGGGDLLKTVVSVDFGKSQHNEALDLFATLKEQGHDAKCDSNVHPATLAAFAREKLREGEEIAFDKLGLYAGKVAKITLPKAPKAKKGK